MCLLSLPFEQQNHTTKWVNFEHFKIITKSAPSVLPVVFFSGLLCSRPICRSSCLVMLYNNVVVHHAFLISVCCSIVKGQMVRATGSFFVSFGGWAGGGKHVNFWYF